MINPKQIFTWWHKQTFGTFLKTLFFGKFVGKDVYGNTYYKSKKERYAWIFYIQAFVYNPIIPHHFGRELWLLVNVASIAVFVGTYLADKKDARA